MSHSPGGFLVSPPGPRMDACSDVEYPLSEAQVPFKSGPQRLLVMLGREAHPYCVARHLSGGLFPGADVTRHPGLGAEDIRAWLSHRAGGQVQDQSTGHASPPPTSPSVCRRPSLACGHLAAAPVQSPCVPSFLKSSGHELLSPAGIHCVVSGGRSCVALAGWSSWQEGTHLQCVQGLGPSTYGPRAQGQDAMPWLGRKFSVRV